jgi:hypothetical protein
MEVLGHNGKQRLKKTNKYLKKNPLRFHQNQEEALAS